MAVFQPAVLLVWFDSVVMMSSDRSSRDIVTSEQIVVPGDRKKASKQMRDQPVADHA